MSDIKTKENEIEILKKGISAANIILTNLKLHCCVLIESMPPAMRPDHQERYDRWMEIFKEHGLFEDIEKAKKI